MAALAPEGLGVLTPTDAEDKPRIRVRLHFGGTFAQDGPRQWRYVGGEVYNESFPLDSKYAEVSKRLNDKFGDTVSFKYLCPGDEIDPDNLVQVQGDDDLREMLDEYQNALQKPSTPVKTVRIKVFVFRAVIFEREVQDLDEELDNEDELLDLPDDGGLGQPLSSGDHEECGPNWSDWGEPDEEITESSIPSAHISSDAELHTGAAAALAAAAATAALHNMSVSVNSISSGRPPAAPVPVAPLTATAAFAGAGNAPFNMGPNSNSSRQSPGSSTQGPTGQRSTGTDVVLPVLADVGGSGGDRLAAGWKGRAAGTSHGGSSSQQWPDAEAAATAAVGGGQRVGTRCGAGAETEGEGFSCASMEADMAAGMAYGAEEGYEEVADGAFGGLQQLDEEGEEDREEDEVLEALRHQQGTGQQRPLQKEWPRPYGGGAQRDWRGPVQEDWQNRERMWERSQVEQQQQQQERRQTQAQQYHDLEQEQERQHLNHRNITESGLGFYCDEELEDPYGDPYEDEATTAAGTGLYGMQIADYRPGRGQQSSAASDGAVRLAPRAADVAAYSDHLRDHYADYAAVGGGAGARGEGGGGPGFQGRFPAAAADMLPRHISAFGESSHDDSAGGGGGGGSGPFLPSRITIFGDHESHGAGGGSSAGGAMRAVVVGGLHRLALLVGSAGTQPWPDPSAAAGLDAAGKAAAVGCGGVGVAAGFLAAGDDILAGDSRQCITQEFGEKHQSSLLEPGGNNGSSGDAAGNGGGGGGGGGGGRAVGGRMSPLDPLDPLPRTGLGAGLGTPLLGMGIDGVDGLSPASVHNHPLKGVVKKRKSEVSILAKIGEGAFGEVSQAQVFPYGIVAIKWLKRERFAKYSESFQREAETLAKLNHPNIIRMYGLVMDTPDTPNFAGGGGLSAGGGCGGQHYGQGGSAGGGSGGTSGTSGAGTPTGLIGGIITEFVRNGSLGQYLRSLNGRRLSLRQRAMIALQASLGMAYLHDQSPAVVHFDLKPDNLLVDGEGDSMVIKVADFGLSKHKLSNYVSCRDLRGTLPYMAYELVSSNGNISEKVDVYSMGVVMWEMYTGEVPFAHLTAQEILTGLLHGNLHLAIPPACEPEWRSLVETCMDPNPANRPSFQELTMQLQEILRLERQASNASSASAAAAAAAAAAVLDSATPPADSGNGGGGGVAAGGGQAVAPGGGGAGGPGAAAVLPGLPHWRMPSPLMPGAPPQGQVQANRSPGGGVALPLPLQPQPPPPLVAPRQQVLAGAGPAQHTPHQMAPPPLPVLVQQEPQHQQQPPPQPQQHVPPILSPLPQHLPRPAHHPAMPPFPIQPYGNLPYGMPQHATPPPPPQQQPPPPPPQQLHQPAPPPPQPQHHAQPPAPTQLHQPPPPPQHHGAYVHHLAPALVLPPHGTPLAQPPPQHHFVLPLRPTALFQQQQPQLAAQHMNAFYGLAGGAGGPGLPPLVSWADRGV